MGIASQTGNEFNLGNQTVNKLPIYTVGQRSEIKGSWIFLQLIDLKNKSYLVAKQINLNTLKI